MNELQVQRTPELIAAEINHIKEETKRIVLNNSIEIGRRLTEAKLLIPHGEWGVWLKENVDYSKTTANNLMNIFNEYGSMQMDLLGSNIKDSVFENITYTQAVELMLIKDPEERKEFVQQNNVEEMSSRELKKAIAERNKAEKEKEKLQKEIDKLKKTNEEERKTLVKAVEEAAHRADDMEIEKNKLFDELTVNTKTVKEAEERIKELEDKINDMGTVDVIPGIDEAKMKEIEDKHQEELKKIKAEKEEAERKLEEIKNAKDNTTTIKFSMNIDAITKDFENLLNLINDVEMNSAEEGLKYKNACKKFINIMLGRL